MGTDRLSSLEEMKQEIDTLERDLSKLKRDLASVEHEGAQAMVMRLFKSKEAKYTKLRDKYDELKKEVLEAIRNVFDREEIQNLYLTEERREVVNFVREREKV